MYLIILGFRESINITLSTFIFSFASLANAVSMIPGGLGVAEATVSGLASILRLHTRYISWNSNYRKIRNAVVWSYYGHVRIFGLQKEKIDEKNKRFKDKDN